MTSRMDRHINAVGISAVREIWFTNENLALYAREYGNGIHRGISVLVKFLDDFPEIIDLVTDPEPIDRELYDECIKTLSTLQRSTDKQRAERHVDRELMALNPPAWLRLYIQLSDELNRTEVAVSRLRGGFLRAMIADYLAHNTPPKHVAPGPVAVPAVEIDVMCSGCRRRQRVWVDEAGTGWCKRCRRPPAGKV